MIEVFDVIGVLAIIAGGLLAAFSARRPTTVKVWASAYLVLVVGVLQVGLVRGWQQLNSSTPILALVAFAIYNLGNVGVVTATVLKHRLAWSAWLVNVSGALLAAAMALLLWSVKGAAVSWTLAWFWGLTVVIFISMPIGLMLSSRHRPRGSKPTKHP